MATEELTVRKHVFLTVLVGMHVTVEGREGEGGFEYGGHSVELQDLELSGAAFLRKYDVPKDEGDMLTLAADMVRHKVMEGR